MRIDTLARYARWFTLIGGFVFGVIGAVWSFAFIDQGNEALKVLTDRKTAIAREIDTLQTTAANYFIANQQSDMIFILGLQDHARRDLASLVLRGNLLDRATPVRNMIGALAIARLLDYRATYDAYAALSDDTRDHLTLDRFTRLKAREKELIEQGQNRVPVLLQQQAELDGRIAGNEASRRRHRALGLASSILGSFLLLLANLLEKRKPAEPTTTAAPASTG